MSKRGMAIPVTAEVKRYVARRDKRGIAVVRIVERGDARELPLRLDVRNHSPTGFDWGYDGSGPAQLALALICDAMGGDTGVALKHYQEFKQRVVSQLPSQGWFLSNVDILEVIGRLIAREATK